MMINEQTKSQIVWTVMDGGVLQGHHAAAEFSIQPSTLRGQYPLHYVLWTNGRHYAAYDTVDEAKTDADDFLETLLFQTQK